MSKIFISIPAWEDSHLIDTMRKCINTADNPKDIVFGLGLKYENEPDLSEFINTVKIVRDQDVADGKPGIAGIREAIRQLITDEEYFLGIDAHIDLLDGWDTNLKNDIEELVKINDKTIISRQATPIIHGQVTGATKWNLRGSYKEFGIDGSVYNPSYDEIKDKLVNDKYFTNIYVSCNFIFGKSKDILNIKWPGYHRFPFEEPEQSLAIYCQGYEVVAPLSGNLYHFAGNDLKYWFDPVNGYDEKWWIFLGGSRLDRSNWVKKWVLDDEDMTMEVRKLMIFGENRYMSLYNYPNSVRDFYNAIGFEEQYDRILLEGLSDGYFYK